MDEALKVYGESGQLTVDFMVNVCPGSKVVGKFVAGAQVVDATGFGRWW